MEVIYTDEFGAWYEGIAEDDREGVAYVVTLLETMGVLLGNPYSSDIKGSDKLRELRVAAGRSGFRVFYAFDPRRDAVLLTGGFKAPDDDKRFYAEVVPKAEAIYAEYLREQEAGLHDEDEVEEESKKPIKQAKKEAIKRSRKR